MSLLIDNVIVETGLTATTAVFVTSMSATSISGITIHSNNTIINANTFNVNNPERLLVDDGGSGGSGFSNTIVGRANVNSYAQLNITNSFSGSNASSDIVATADNGNETSNYIDVGINSSTFSGYLGLPNDAYMYSTGNDLWVGNVTPSKNLYLFSDGPLSSNIRVTINSGSTKFNVPISANTISATTFYGNGANLSGIVSSFNGGTVTGATNFTNGLTANTFSATTYVGLPTNNPNLQNNPNNLIIPIDYSIVFVRKYKQTGTSQLFNHGLIRTIN